MIWGTFICFIAGLIFFLCSVVYVQKVKKRVKCMVCFQTFFVTYLFSMAILLKFIGLHAHAFIAISTNLCSEGENLLESARNTINIFPETISGLAAECFYSGSTGKLTNLIPSENMTRFDQLMELFSAQEIIPSEYNLTDPSYNPIIVTNVTELPFLSHRLFHKDFIAPRHSNPLKSYDSSLELSLHSPAY